MDASRMPQSPVSFCASWRKAATGTVAHGLHGRSWGASGTEQDPESLVKQHHTTTFTSELEMMSMPPLSRLDDPVQGLTTVETNIVVR